MSNDLIITATFVPGWQRGDDFACATATFTVNGGPLGYASDTIIDLMDVHGVTFEIANEAVYRMWDHAEAAADRTATAKVDRKWGLVPVDAVL